MKILEYASQALKVFHHSSKGVERSPILPVVSCNDFDHNNKMSPLVELICRSMEKNDLHELKLGWPQQQGEDKNNSHKRYCSKEVNAIVYSLRNYSATSLTTVSLGGACCNRFDSDALRMILSAVVSLPCLESVTIVAMQLWIPDSTMKALCQNPNLRILDIQGGGPQVRKEVGVILKTTNASPYYYHTHDEDYEHEWNDPPRYHDSSSSNKSIRNDPSMMITSAENYIYQKFNFVDCLMDHLSHSYAMGLFRLKTLKLVYCGVRDEHISELCQQWFIPYISAHNEKKDDDTKSSSPFVILEHLSLAGNAKITSRGLKVLLRHPYMRQLDLSECRIDDMRAHSMAETITVNSSSSSSSFALENLILARNYRLSTTSSSSKKSLGVIELFRACIYRLTTVDLSFCGLTMEPHLTVMFQLLEDRDCRLENLILQGCQRHISGHALCKMLRHNDSLRSLVLHKLGSKSSVKMRQQQQQQQQQENKMEFPSSMIDELFRIISTQNYKFHTLQVDWTKATTISTQNYDSYYNRKIKELDFYLRLNRVGRQLLKERNQYPAEWSYVFANAAASMLPSSSSSHTPDVLYFLIRHTLATLKQQCNDQQRCRSFFNEAN